MGTVDEQKIRSGIKLFDRHDHCTQRGLENVDAIDDLRIDYADTDGHRIPAYLPVGHEAFTGRQLFGIADAVQGGIIGPNDRGRHHRSCQGASSGLVHPGHPSIALCQGVVFKTLQFTVHGLSAAKAAGRRCRQPLPLHQFESPSRLKCEAPRTDRFDRAAGPGNRPTNF